MWHQRLAGFLFPGELENDAEFRREIQRLSHRSLRTIGYIQIVAGVTAGVLRSVTSPQDWTVFVRQVEWSAVALIGAGTLLLSRWSRVYPYSRPIAIASGVATFATIGLTTAFIGAADPVGTPLVPFFIVVGILMGASTIPIRPMDTLCLSVLGALPFLAASWASAGWRYPSESLPIRYWTMWATMTLISTGLTAVVYKQRHNAYLMNQRLRQAQSDLRRANFDLKLRNQELQEQRTLAESLLRNILPGQVADELRSTGRSGPRSFDDVTVLFSDFVGFTTTSAALAPENLIEALNDYFTAFDVICGRYGLERLKTIGDSYMCVGGMPSYSPSHAVDSVLAAFDMIYEVNVRSQSGRLLRWPLRIGIHTGPVIAGVVGIRKFAYDIWGTTVNFASRVESSGAPNRINLSVETYELVKDFYECECRGKVMTKEKLEADMYFVLGLRPELSRDGDSGKAEAFRSLYLQRFHKEAPALPPVLLRSSASGV